MHAITSHYYHHDHLHRTHTVKDSRGVRKCLLVVFCRECVKRVVSYLGYHPFLFRNIWGCTCYTGPLRLYDREDIYKASYPPHRIGSFYFPFVVILFSWLWASGGCTINCSRFHMLPGKAGFCFFNCCAVFWPGGRILLFVHYTPSISSLCGCVWKYWTYKFLVRYFLSCMCLRLSQFSQLSFMH